MLWLVFLIRSAGGEESVAAPLVLLWMNLRVNYKLSAVIISAHRDHPARPRAPLQWRGIWGSRAV